MRVLIWCAPIQAAAGFTSIFSFLLAMLAGALHVLSSQAAQAAFQLDYLLMIFLAIGIGLLTTLSIWRIACRERTLIITGLLPTTGST